MQETYSQFVLGKGDKLIPNMYCWQCGRLTIEKPTGVENNCPGCLTKINLRRLAQMPAAASQGVQQ